MRGATIFLLENIMLSTDCVVRIHVFIARIYLLCLNNLIILNVDSLFVLLMCITAGCDFFSSGIQSHVLNWIRWAALWLFLIDVHSHRSRAHLYDPVLWNDTILTHFVHCEHPSLVQNNRSLTHPTWSHALKYDPPCLSPQRLANNSANSKSPTIFFGMTYSCCKR